MGTRPIDSDALTRAHKRTHTQFKRSESARVAEGKVEKYLMLRGPTDIMSKRPSLKLWGTHFCIYEFARGANAQATSTPRAHYVQYVHPARTSRSRHAHVTTVSISVFVSDAFSSVCPDGSVKRIHDGAAVTSVAPLHPGVVLSGAKDGTLALFDVYHRKTLHHWRAHDKEVTRVELLTPKNTSAPPYENPK